MLTHRNIINNVGDIITGIRLIESDVSVSWLPLYHDMGLIGFHITPTMVGVSQTFIQPLDFVKNPFLWLDKLTEEAATITSCPNFGQHLVIRSIKRGQPRSWNLRSVRVLFNAAEPISIPAMSDFLSALEPFGLQAGAMFPAYGLAEATLAVTFSPIDTQAEIIHFDRISLFQHHVAVPLPDDDENGIPLVNLGRPVGITEARIVDDKMVPLSENRVGNIIVRGENVAAGYINDPGSTRQTFSDGWLNTGDIGFIHEGNLFVMGRTKDVIFVNGMNLYAHDLESIAFRISEVQYGKLVIAGYFDETEGRDRVIVFLVAPDNEATRDLFGRIRQLFLKTLGLPIDTFIPVRSNDIPRTSSGKIQRYKMVNRFLHGEFSVVRI
jgi:acyl-CoA synthetase (AMP-forming)/AMP-acid ligase II